MFLVLIFFMLAISALASAYEMALASVSRTRLEILAQERHRGVGSAIFMKDHIERGFATVQILNTMTAAISAAFGSLAIDQWMTPLLQEHFNMSPAVARIVTLILLLLPLSAMTITFGELVPKMVGINHRERVVLRLSPVMRLVAWSLHPAILFFEWVVKGVMKVWQRLFLGKAERALDHVSLLELRTAAAMARATQVIGPLEERIVVAAAQLSGRSVGEVMVPAHDIKMIPESMSISDALVEAHLHMHTRYPVCQVTGEVESIKGYVTFKDIVCCMRINPEGGGVKGIMRPIRRFDADLNLAEALTAMIRDRLHIVLVVAEGRVQGLLTMEEVVEELVGDIDDEYDRLPAQIYPVGGGWLVGGGATLEDVADAIGREISPQADPTMLLANWINRKSQRPLRSGDIIAENGVEVLVRKIRRNRITETLVRWQVDEP